MQENSNIMRLKSVFYRLAIIGLIIGIISSVWMIFEGEIAGGICVFIVIGVPSLTLLIYCKNVYIEWNDEGIFCSNFFGVIKTRLSWTEVESYTLSVDTLQLKINGDRILEIDTDWQNAIPFIEEVSRRCKSTI